MTLIIHSLVFLMFLLMIQPTRLRRLQRIVDMIPTGSIVADIGADHGLLSASLAHSSLRVYAIERSEVAARNGVISLVQEKQLQDKVHILIGDGLQPLIHSKVDFVDTAIMAGIGTNSILNILENGTSESLRTLGITQLVLQPFPPNIMKLVDLCQLLVNASWICSGVSIESYKSHVYHLTFNFHLSNASNPVLQQNPIFEFASKSPLSERKIWLSYFKKQEGFLRPSSLSVVTSKVDLKVSSKRAILEQIQNDANAML